MEYFKDKPLNRYIESMYEHIKDGSLEDLGDKVGVHTENGEKIPGYCHRMDMYGAPFGLTGEELGNRLLDGMDSGQIMMEGGGFSAKNEYDFDRFVEACRMKGVDVEKMMEKCTQMIKGM